MQKRQTGWRSMQQTTALCYCLSLQARRTAVSRLRRVSAHCLLLQTAQESAATSRLTCHAFPHLFAFLGSVFGLSQQHDGVRYHQDSVLGRLPATLRFSLPVNRHLPWPRPLLRDPHADLAGPGLHKQQLWGRQRHFRIGPEPMPPVSSGDSRSQPRRVQHECAVLCHACRRIWRLQQ